MRRTPVIVIVAIVLVALALTATPAVRHWWATDPFATAPLAASATPAPPEPSPSPSPSPPPSLPPPPPSPSPSPPPPPSPSPTPVVYGLGSVKVPLLRAPAHLSSVTVSEATLFGWALRDRLKNRVTGSANDATVQNTMESMIKPWITADYLRQLSAAGKKPTDAILDDLRLMIIDSNDHLAQVYYKLDGADASVARLVKMCGLTDTELSHDRWSYTLMTPLDATRYGLCLADGVAAGPVWTKWLLTTMTQVRGDVDDKMTDTRQGGRWGIIDAFPTALAPGIAIKNGWTQYVDGWHINCLAVTQNWILNVMVRTETLDEGDAACQSVTKQLLPKA